ncbi:RDD family protein [Myxococcus stipitatus]|uniref:RDD family protein n=1 Tax=Myxococcus stipitatus TaxID=83455 RepID=UPI001E5EF6D3|nr:RDD family protein [Myxococcus stipitatus]
MSKCMKCGALLPPVGDCPACAKAAAQTTLPGVPSFLDRDLMIDRRAPGRAEGPAFAERSPAPPPAVAPLAGPLPPPAEPRVATPRNAPGIARPTPPGMTPAARPASGQPAWAQAQPQAPGGSGFPLNVPPPPASVQPSLSPMTPAYGTPSAARARAAAGPALPVVGPESVSPVADTLPGTPFTEPKAPAPSGLPRMGPAGHLQAAASGLPHAAGSAQQHAASGLPHAAGSAPSHAAAGLPHAAGSQPHAASGLPQAVGSQPRATSGLPQAVGSQPHAASGLPQAAGSAQQHAAASGQQRMAASGQQHVGGSGLPHAAASGQQRMGTPAQPQMPTSAQPHAATSGLPHMPSSGPSHLAASEGQHPAASSTGLPRMAPASGQPPMAAAPGQAPLSAALPGVARTESAASGLPQMAQAPSSHLHLEADSSGLPPMEPLDPASFSLPPLQSVAPAPGLPVMEQATPRAEKPRPQAAPSRSQPGVAEVHARPASLWRRLLSFSIDTAAIGGVAALYITLASSVTGVKSPEAGLSGLDGFVAWLRALHTVLLPGFFLVLLLALVYCAVAAFLWNGRTLGRLLLGLRLVDTHGLAPAPGRAIVRAMLSSVSFVLFLGGFWMALFDRRGQTLHDKLTSTFVVQPS